MPTKRRENIRMWGRASTLLMWKWTRARRDLSVKSFKEVAICKRLARHIPRNLLFCHVAQQVLIEFDGETYRTKSYNKVLDLIFQQTNELRGEKKENGERFPSFSVSVPRPGTRHRNHRKTKEFIFLIISHLYISYFLHFCHILPIFRH